MGQKSIGTKLGQGCGRPWEPFASLIDTFQLFLPIPLTFEMLFFFLIAITSNAYVPTALVALFSCSGKLLPCPT